jgi:hypothetical protein
MLISAQNRWCWFLATSIGVFFLIGCATSKPPYNPVTKVLPPEQFSLPNPPEVHVRCATPEEAKSIAEFPGKKGQELASKVDSAGSLLLAPALLVFFFPEFLNPDNWHIRQDPKIKEALEQFPSRLAKGIEQRFSVSSSGESLDRLEVVYFADVSTIGPAADRVCFVVHAQITLQSKEEVLFRDIIRIDPRAFNDVIQQPDCTQSPDRILVCADEVIPKMIQGRLPGLPWKTSP